MAVLINTLRDMDVTHTADVLTKPVLAQKLDAVARLCQTRLSNYARDESFGDDRASGLEGLDVLVETYRLKLLDAIGRPDEQAAGSSDGVDLRVDDFIKRCLRGETRKVHCAEARQPGKHARNADEALEVLLDGLLGTLKEDRGGVASLLTGAELDLAAGNANMAASAVLD
jgi:hypothetical protein